MLIVLVIGFGSFDIARKASIEKQAQMLRGITTNSFAEISAGLKSGDDLMLLFEKLQKDMAANIYFHVNDRNGNLTHILSPQDDTETVYSFIDAKQDFGQSASGDKLFTWVSQDVQGTPYIFSAVYVEEGSEEVSFFKQGGMLLAFSLLLVVWLSSLLAMLVSRLVSQLNEKNIVLKYRTMHDDLTGLPNRNMLLGHLEQAIAAGRRSKKSHALLLVDLNGFKDINDALGHHYGDDLLIQISRILSNVVRNSDVVARIDGDEFAVMLFDTDQFGAEIVGRKIIDQLEQLLIIDKEKFFVAASVGISMFPDHGEIVNELMNCADRALAEAKKQGINLAFYTVDENQEKTELSLVSDLRDAIENDVLELYYQPKYDLTKQTVTSAEALIRWQHPTMGMLPPPRFISLAERTGLMGRLTLWVMKRAFHDYAIIKALGHDIAISLNLSVQNLNDSRFVDQVSELVDQMKIDPRRFTLEVTESAIVHDAIRVSEVLTRLREMGFSVSIDDFGTGYSSFINFKKLPIDEIKIDRTFVFNAVQSEQDASIIEAAVNVGKAFGFSVVAEGIEDEATVALLCRLGCKIGQGFHFARPMEMVRFTHWLKQDGLTSVESVDERVTNATFQIKHNSV